MPQRPLVLFALGLLASCAAQSAEEVRARRWIRGEPSTARQVLALPYGVVALTGWPLERTLDWMEEVNLPARVGDVVVSPLGRIGEPEP
jgi:hypothetical protein